MGLPPTCGDGAANQDESDVDCGGSLCGACADALACRTGSDCASATCRAGACRPANLRGRGARGLRDGRGLRRPGLRALRGRGLCAAGGDCVTGVCSATGECTATSFSDGFEAGAPLGAAWSTTGSLPWIVSGATPISGTYSARSGAIGDGETSGLGLALTCYGAGSVTFTFRTDSELGFDRLAFAIDGTEVLGWSGIESGITVSYPLGAGTRALSWTYEKDGFGSEGRGRRLPRRRGGRRLRSLTPPRDSSGLRG
ncbi:MAG: hypothetical protein M5U28_53490 [Sandaracinaceae bacterium]|nr:hypothetical protein [Sandaracinaceae bacterium]